MSLYKQVRDELRAQADVDWIPVIKRFFKLGDGEYGYGDKFLGISIPKQRVIANKYYSVLKLDELSIFLSSPYHEERMFSLIVLTTQSKTLGRAALERNYSFYMKNLDSVNSWDLVDLSAPELVGAYLFGGDSSLLFQLAVNSSLWQRRIAIVATWYFIRRFCFRETLAVAKILLADSEDLIHKAVGWMLREVGKRDFAVTYDFLLKNQLKISRTTLRYALELFPKEKRVELVKSLGKI